MRLSNDRYPLYVIILLVVTLLAATQPLASVGWLPIQLDLLTRMLDQPPHLAWMFLLITTGVLGLGALFVYTRALNPYAERRPLGWVWLNAFAPLLFLAIGMTANEHPDSLINAGWKTGAGWGAALLLPTLLLGVEQALHKIFSGMGDTSRGRGWRRTALKFYNSALRLRPARPGLLKVCGLLHREEDECPAAIALLERLGPVERSEDDQVLRALEVCYRSEGYERDALNCLLRLRQLRLDTPGLDRKILDDQIKLGMYAEALQLVESGRLKQNQALLLLQQNLHLRLEHYDEAMRLARQVEVQEAAPWPQAERLYRELVAEQPDAVEPRIALGQLLLANQQAEARAEGTVLLEAIVSAHPEQGELARQLYDHYREEPGDTFAESRALYHLEKLVAASDADLELYLELARRYTESGRGEDAEGVLRHMLTLEPGEWRARLRLGRLLFGMNRLDEAEAELKEAAAGAPEEDEAAAMVSHLRHELDQRRRELRLSRFEPGAEGPDAAREGDGDSDESTARTRSHLEHLEELLWLQRTDQALKLAEQILASHQDRRSKVEELVREAAERTEQNFRLLDYLTDLYLEEGRIDEALELYRRMSERALHPEQMLVEGCDKILAQAPGHAEARLELALARRGQQDWEGVLAALDPLMNGPEDPLEPADKALWVEATFRLNRLEEAIRVGLGLAEALAAEPGFMLLLIDVLQAADRHQDAYDIYQRARAAAPDDPRLARLARRISNNRRTQRLGELGEKATGAGLEPHEHYEKAELHREMGQIGEAIIHYQRAADQEQLAVLALAKMATSLADKGMYDLAEEILNPLTLTREIETTHPELKDLFYNVARQLERIKRPDLASKYYKRIFRVDAAFKDIVERLERIG